MKMLMRRQFGNPILRQKASRLSPEQIASTEIKQLISDMKTALKVRKYGIGLAAPQVGQSLALSVIAIKPTPTRPNHPIISMVIINPEITQTYGKRTGLWEGCISFGMGSSSPYAQALRYKKVRVRYLDQNGVQQEDDFDGILGHVLQHEIDHLNGILFVDRVKNSKTYMTISEYRKRYVRRPAPKRKGS
jgi:peptide deformylase